MPTSTRKVRLLATLVAFTSLLGVAAAPNVRSGEAPSPAPYASPTENRLSTVALRSHAAGEGFPLDPPASSARRPNFPWRVIDGKFWQVVAATPSEDPRVTDLREGNRGACNAGMIEVAGRMKDDSGDLFGVDGLQQLTCKKWINRE